MGICRAIDEPTFASRSGQITSLATRDPRSDNMLRLVAVDRDCVSIERCYKGIHMSLAVPVAAYHGVTLIAADDGGYEVHLVHRDPDLSIPLQEARDGREAVAELHAWAQILALPALEGSVSGGIGYIAVSPPIDRAGGVSPTRRPRFLMRRKSGRVERMTIVHRDEREIIARD